MIFVSRNHLIILGIAAGAWLGGGAMGPGSSLTFIATAEALIGHPATPMSYAGVARRSTVGVGAPGVGVAPVPGVGYGGVGGPASGIGVLPGAGAGQVGVGYSGGVGVNLGGPVNRVGVR